MTIQRDRPWPTSPTGPLPAVVEHRTGATFDIDGHLLAVIDALGRVSFAYIYDLGKQALLTTSLDAGTRTVVFDAMGHEIERRDTKSALTVRRYDILHRLDRVWARNDAAQSVTLRELLTYGDGGRPDQPSQARAASRASSSLGRPVSHLDEAGELSLGPYDFKGNLLAKTRQVIADAAIAMALDSPGSAARRYTVDWDNAPSLEGRHETSMTYDALNRLKTMQYPEDVGDAQRSPARQTLQPQYNRAGLLERVIVDSAPYVAHIAYNARRQRVLIAYGNGIMTRYAYDPDTFRLTRFRTEGCTITGTTYSPDFVPLQDVAHTYDVAGNILAIIDQMPGCGVRNNPLAGPFSTDDEVVAQILASRPALKPLLASGDALVRSLKYDALSRLVSATGREANDIAHPRPLEDVAREGFNWTGGTPTTTTSTARDRTRVYNETYTYDPVGNMLAIHHGGWNRHFGMAGFTPKEWKDKVSDFAAGGSPLWGTQGSRLTNVGTGEDQGQSHTYDGNGNLTREFTNRHFSWDWADRLVAFADRATAGSVASKEAAYLYDSGGQRIKTFTRRQTGEIETITCIDGVFEHHRWTKPGALAIQNTTLHLLDNQNRLAMVRVGDACPGDGAPSVTVKYHLGDHLGSSSIVIGGGSSAGDTFINREEYFPYGETSLGSFARKRYRFTGMARDEESGLSYHGARHYAPWLARWVSSDPARLAVSQTTRRAPFDPETYLYAKNSPLVLLDTDGRAAKVFYVTLMHADINIDPYLKNLESYGRQAAKTNGVEHLTVRSLDDMVTQIKARLDPDDTISKLTIASHGTPQGTLLIPSEETTQKRGYQSPDTLKHAAVRLGPVGLQTIQEKAAGARIDLHACNVGQSKQGMEGWAQFFGGKNVTVGAPKVFIEFWAPRDDGPIRIHLDKDMKHGNGLLWKDGMKNDELFNEQTFDSGPLGDEGRPIGAPAQVANKGARGAATPQDS